MTMLLTGSCSGRSQTGYNDGTDGTSDSAEVTTAELHSELPERDFGGKDFRIICWFRGEGHIHNFFEYDAEEQNGELLNDTIYSRNRAVEDRFGINISASGSETTAADAYKLTLAGDTGFNVVADRPVVNANYSTQGAFMRFDKLPYVDLTKPWWNMNAGEYFRIDDKLYFMTGDYVLYEKQRLPAMMVNLSMAEDYEIEDLYAAVDEGRWTVDLMNTYAVLVKDDLDGDGTMDYHNDDPVNLIV